MFGIGYTEMLIIGLVAMVVFGPARIPELAGQVGRWVREFRRMTADLSEEFEKTVAEADDIKRSITGEVTGMRSQVQSVTDSVKKDLTGSAAATKPGAKRPASGTGTGAGGKKLGTAAERSSSVKKVGGTANGVAATGGTATAVKANAAAPAATKADPLADVSMMDDEPELPTNGFPLERIEAKNGSAKANGAAADGAATAGLAGAATANGSPGAGGDDEAIVRARRRRATAGYGRRS